MKDAGLRLFAAVALLAGFAGIGRSPAKPADAVPAHACEAADAADEVTLANCLALQPRSVELLMALGDRYERASRDADAEVLYRRAAGVDARDADVHLRLSRVLARRGDIDGARAARARVDALRPGTIESRILPVGR